MTAVDRLTALPTGARRAVALLMLAAVLLAAWWLIAMPLRWLITSQQAWRSAVRIDLARSRGEADLLPVLRQRLATLPNDPIWSRFYDATAGEEVDSLIRQDVARLCDDSQITVGSLIRLPSRVEGNLVAYGVRLTAATTADRLRSFADRLRAAPRYLRVQQLHVSAPEAQQRDENPVLTVTADVFGYARSAEPPVRGAPPP